MMSVAPVASAGTAAGYYSNSDNYYFLGNLQSIWIGEGAKELGLEGHVKADNLTALLEGRLPDGTRLGKEINGNHVHRPGHDLTFSAPKSVSILALIGGDKDMVDAHNHAVQVAAGYVEKLISARETKDGVTSIMHTGKMVGAAFTHDTSRNLDPQLHTHLVIANMTELSGKWKALATDYIHDAGFIETVMKMQVTLGKIYRAALRERVEEMGHEVEVVGKHGMWEIKGVPEEVRDEYSSRGREVQGAVGAEATLRSRDIAAKDTRRAKVDPSRMRLMERWQGQMKDKGFDLKEYMESVISRRDTDKSTSFSVPEKMSEPTFSNVGTPADKGITPQQGEQEKVSEEKQNTRWELPDIYIPQSTKEQMSPKTPGDSRTSWVIPSLLNTRTPELQPEVIDAVRQAISHLSDGKTRFTWGELMLTATEFSEQLPGTAEIKAAIDASLKEGLIIPLDSEKGVFTSRIHLLDELSIQALSKEHLASSRVVSFNRPSQYAPQALEAVEKDAVVLMNAPSGVAGIRELTAQLADISVSHGRDVQVLASSAERATSLAKADALRERLISRQHVLSGEFSLKPQSTLIIEGAERLGLKETLVLLGEAREKDAQLVFLDSAGRQANGNAMSVLESAGVTRSRRTEPAPGLEAEVISIADKRNRYEALANRYAELSAGTEPVTAVVIGQREQQHMTGLIRDALQNAGQLERDGVTIEARAPVWLDSKTRKMASTYRAGQVLEDRSDAKDIRHYVVERVHEDTRVLSLIDSDGVLSRHKISDLTADWRLFIREQLNVSTGEQLIAVAGDRDAGLKAKDRLKVTGIGEQGIEALRDGKPVLLPADRPLYVKHSYVSAPGGRDNDTGIVLAALNTRDITAQTVNSLAQSGHRTEIFTAEVQDRAEARLQRMRTNSSPVQLIRRLSGNEHVDVAISTLRSGVKSEAELAVWRAIEDERGVSFNSLELAEKAHKYVSDGETKLQHIGYQIDAMVKKGDLLSVILGGVPQLVAGSTWEMEKSIIRVIDEGKNTQSPLMEQVDPKLLAGLTAGQKQAASLVLATSDQFIGIQGYAGVGKTTQVKAVKAAIETLPVDGRPAIIGLAPTHQAVKELTDVGMTAQTVKSFLVEHDQRVAAGEKPDYRSHMFLIDESSMIGNQDTAATYIAIQAGGGRAVSMGDIDQFESVDSGAPFKLMQERSPMDVAIMKEIVRQKEVQLKDAVHDIIDNRIDAAIQRLEVQSAEKVPRVPGFNKAYLPTSGIFTPEDPNSENKNPEDKSPETVSVEAAIAKDYLSRTPDARNRTIIITQLNKDRHSVNKLIHTMMVKSKEVGEETLVVPVLNKIKHTRHEFNKVSAWQPGMVVKRGDRYQDVISVDTNGKTVFVKDEEGNRGMYSPRELISGDVELFTRSEMTLNPGVELRFTATDRERGQTGNQRFTVQSVKENGDVVLKGAAGTKTINPRAVLAEQHIDYGWAVTGYGAQGASSDYVIAYESAAGARKAMATKRAFYITTSRAKEHVQIYTDQKDKWIESIKEPDGEFKTAHDILKPETQRKQAKAIWAMGQPVSKTAIGRAWSRHQGIDSQTMTAKVIPATRRFPEPALALPVYDDNGKSAGLALVSLVSSSEGRLTQGETRMVVTERAQGAVLQRSQTGNTIVVKDLSEALEAVKAHPRDGVVWQTGDAKVSEHLMKVTKGHEAADQNSAVRIIAEREQQIVIPTISREPADGFDQHKAVSQTTQVLESMADTELQNVGAASRHSALHEQTDIPHQAEPDKKLLQEIVVNEKIVRGEQDDAARLKTVPELAPESPSKEVQLVSRTVNELADAERDIIRKTHHSVEPGRAIEHEEPNHTRHIQKER
ncbi:conjugative transfer relaxase/helicase TraI [Pseudescherichia vulneris]|uniref:conjugative transfer relaxase/helicase TraI n=1 Tax=Pseudescherichia vulneris TaxID=566 RepID=UPI001EE0C24C|nr:conjugative transfer relaxase/helicase TraI [Pseudescherichia vulneris]